jgi:glycosyltransferase involved in cell wall biosynthesis
MKTTASVLMSVYHRVVAEELSACLQSLLWQTRPADQIVIALDGPLPETLLQTLESFQKDATSQVELVKLPSNVGLTGALNAALPLCTGEWLLRMDADDIALPDRFEKQLAFVETHSNVDVLGTALYEFSHEPSNPEKTKPVIREHAGIAGSIGLRNPINHPTVCVRKQLIEDQGGYPDLPLLEDYYLWARLLKAGARFHNLDEPLYLFRFDDSTLDRRSGTENFKNEVWLRRWMKQEGLISPSTLWAAAVLQVVLRFAPNGLRRWLWHRSRTATNLTLDLPH